MTDANISQDRALDEAPRETAAPLTQPLTPGAVPVAVGIDARSDLKHRAVRAVLWSSVSKISQQVLQFAITVVLARLLVPADFGLVAEILVFTGFATVLVDFGFSAALIQREDLEERHLSSAFWLNLGFGLVLTLVVAALGPALAAFYNEPQLTFLTAVMALIFVVQSLGIVQGMLLERALKFRRLAVVNSIATGASGVAAVGAAVAGLGAWSIVLQVLVAGCARSLLLWVTSDWRPRVSVDVRAIRELWGFSANLAGFNMVNYWSRNADNLLIGRFVSAAALGIYSRAYSLMLLPMSQITAVISVVMYPALARMQDDPARLRAAYLRVVGMVAFIAFPVATGLFVAAKPFVLTFLGSRWAGVVPIFQILCVPLLVQTVGATVGLVYQTCGRTDWMFRWGLATAGITIVGFAIGIHWGAKGVAISYAILTLALTYPGFSIPGRLLAFSFSDVFRAVRTPLAAACVAAATGWLAGLTATRLGYPIQLMIELVPAVGVYALLAHVFSLSAYRELLELMRQRRKGIGLAT